MKKQILLLICATSLAFAQPIDHLITTGRVALQQKNKDEAHTAFAQALEQYPNNSDALFYMGVLHYYANEGSRALPYLKRCYEQNPEHEQHLNAYAIIANHMGEFDLARDIIEAHYGAEPGDAALRTKLLPIYIRNRDWYYALKLCNINDLWWYNEDINNQSVLLDLSSQWNGHGDVMQIVRYAKHLHGAGARVTVYVRPEMVALLSLCPYIEQAIPTTHPKPSLEKQYTLTADRLILIMRDTLHAQSNDTPYLYTDEALCTKWRAKLAHYHTFKVGVCFQSTKMKDYFTGETHPGPRGMRGDEIAPLLKIPGVSFFSLHKGSEPEAKALCRYNTFHVFDELDTSHGAFMDTAALMKQLDLVITVDTSIAHLAGALGVSVWVMMPHATDFRWLGADENCPWYPSMKLFVQSKQGEWKQVIERVKETLQNR